MLFSRFFRPEPEHRNQRRDNAFRDEGADRSPVRQGFPGIHLAPSQPGWRRCAAGAEGSRDYRHYRDYPGRGSKSPMSGILNPEVLVLGARRHGRVRRGRRAAGSRQPGAGSGPRRHAHAGAGRTFRRRARAGADDLRRASSATTTPRALVARLRKRKRPLRAVFASLATPLESGRLLDKPTDFLRQKLEDDLMPHLAAARHLIPLPGRAGRHVRITS